MYCKRKGAVCLKNSLKLSGVYIGTILGAGFASGKEILVFFGQFGVKGIYGLFLAGILFFLLGWLIMNKIYVKQIDTFDEYFSNLSGKLTIKIFRYIMIFFLFFVMSAMFAGCGALLEESFGLHKYIGIIFMATVTFIVMVYGARGIVIFNGIVTPFMVISLVLFSIYSIFWDTRGAFFQLGFQGNLNWVLYALIYVSYNTITITMLFVSLRKYVDNQKTAFRAGLISGGVLLAIMFVLWCVLMLYRAGSSAFAIPLLYVVMNKGNFVFIIYCITLCCAMLTTSVSNGFSLLSGINRIGKLPSFLLCAAGSVIAGVGFSVIVEKFYTLFGFLGLFILCITIFDGLGCIGNSKNKKSQQKQRKIKYCRYNLEK